MHLDIWKFLGFFFCFVFFLLQMQTDLEAENWTFFKGGGSESVALPPLGLSMPLQRAG